MKYFLDDDYLERFLDLLLTMITSYYNGVIMCFLREGICVCYYYSNIVVICIRGGSNMTGTICV